MEHNERNLEADLRSAGINPDYAVFQLAKALTTSQEHEDLPTRERARAKIEDWATVLRSILTGSVEYGSRTPIGGVPAWATLEVITGGFATGGLLAAGSLKSHELDLLNQLPEANDGEDRRVLNGHFLTDDGLSDLRNWLGTGCYDICVPEEGALLVVAWLVDNGRADMARSLLEEISPWFAKMRFYPVPLQRPRTYSTQVYLQDVSQTIADLSRIKPNRRILAQKEAVEIWAPYYDRIVELFVETIVDGWPCRTYPDGWSQRAVELLSEYAELRKTHGICSKPEKAKGYFAQLRQYLVSAASQPQLLTGRDVGRIRLIIHRYVEKRGLPLSEKCKKARSKQREHVAAPICHDVGKVVISRLEKRPPNDGLDDLSQIHSPIDAEESRIFRVPVDTSVPKSIQRKVERCLNETVDVLVDRGLITSGETLARVLPQMTSGLQAAGISDPSLRRLYAAIYRSFRQRRSLLLLNLEKQVQIEELPWVAAIDSFRDETLSSRQLASQTLEEITLLTITSFPHAILPNKLLQELTGLAKTAALDIPLVEEVAADIFMGKFSGKFVESAKKAADVIEGSLYANYYGIDCGEIRRLTSSAKTTKKGWLQKATADPFAEMCSCRAGVPLGTWDPATNGMIIEQQQILTTQNLAALLTGLCLTDAIRVRLGGMARYCFQWICERQQMKIDRWHARLIMVKNTAYAWRQMIFFVSLLPKGEASDFLHWASEHLESQQKDFVTRFRPALQGLTLAAEEHLNDDLAARNFGARRFLGWSKEQHWLLGSS